MPAVDGTVALSGAAAQFAFDEYNPYTRQRVSSIEVNISASSMPCTVPGTSTESYPTLSLDSMSVVFPCWTTPVGGTTGNTFRHSIGRFFVEGELDWPKGSFTTVSSGLRSASWTGRATDGYWIGTSSGMKYAVAGASQAFFNVGSSTSSSIRGVAWSPNGGMFVAHYQSPTPGIAFRECAARPWASQ